MKTISSLRAGRLLTVVASLIAGASVYAQIPAGSLLNNYNLLSPYAGTQDDIEWTNLSNTNPRYVAAGSLANWQNPSLGDRRLRDDSNVADLRVLLGGYPATFGVYAWGNDFGLEVPSKTTGYDIKNVVLQVEQIGNPDFYDPNASPVVGTPDDLLFFNDPLGTYPTGHGYNAALDALISTGRTTYAGGPVLRFDDGSGVQVLQADPSWSALVNAVYDPGFGATWFNFAYQFDLSGETGVTWVQVSKPSVVHEATTAVKISTSSAYTTAFSL